MIEVAIKRERQTTTRTPRVSVIMPAYNVAQYIAEALDSVFAQTFTDYEVIVVNDGSPDTPALERALAPYRERIIYLVQKNGGVSAARNAALRETRGEFVAFLDPDDAWLPDYLAAQVKRLDTEECDLSYANAYLFKDARDADESERTFMRYNPSEGAATYEALLALRCNVPTSGTVARRDAVFAAGLFDETIRVSEDFDLWLRIARRDGRLTYEHTPLLRHRRRADSLTASSARQLNAALHVLNLVERRDQLSPSEFEALQQTRAGLQRAADLEAGKGFLAAGDYAAARGAFARACVGQANLKVRIARLAARIAPALLRRIYLWRAGDGAVNGIEKVDG